MKINLSNADLVDDVKCLYASLALLLFLVVAPVSNAQITRLQSGTVVDDAIDFDAAQSRKYRIDVPADAYALRVELSEAPTDLDIVLERPDGELVTVSETDRFNEWLFLTRISDPPLETGEMVISVIYQYVDRPVLDGREADSIPFRISLELVTARASSALVLGTPQTGMLLPGEGMVRTYRVDVSPEADELRLDILEATGDVDLFLNYGAVAVDPLTADYVSQSYLGRESLVITRESHPPLRTGSYYVTVLDQIEDEVAGEFTLVASIEGVPTEILGAAIPVPSPRTPLERALLATVQIVTDTGGGSGCVVSPQGHILTSWHVVRDKAGRAAATPAVALSIDHTSPPEERFRARVLRYSEERDLALLHIETGLYGEPLAEPLDLPYFEIGDADDLYFGDELWFVGYPDVGGTGSRVSITVTRGIVSGFERSSFGRIVKTDGEINEGNSGGAALNRAFELVGLPTRVVGQDAGQIAYVHPVTAVPESWWTLIGR